MIARRLPPSLLDEAVVEASLVQRNDGYVCLVSSECVIAIEGVWCAREYLSNKSIEKVRYKIKKEDSESEPRAVHEASHGRPRGERVSRSLAYADRRSTVSRARKNSICTGLSVILRGEEREREEYRARPIASRCVVSVYTGCVKVPLSATVRDMRNSRRERPIVSRTPCDATSTTLVSSRASKCERALTEMPFASVSEIISSN